MTQSSYEDNDPSVLFSALHLGIRNKDCVLYTMYCFHQSNSVEDLKLLFYVGLPFKRLYTKLHIPCLRNAVDLKLKYISSL